MRIHPLVPPVLFIIFWLAIAVAAFAQQLSSQPQAVKSGAWSSATDDEKLWLQQQTSKYGSSCCGLGDAIKVQITGGDDQLVMMKVIDGKGHLPEDMILTAPRDLIISGIGGPNPFGETIAWVSSTGHVYCVAPVWES